jgi:cytochrome c biogenesis protein CcdA/thiol-disulfide isomerase/thioredoxin
MVLLIIFAFIAGIVTILSPCILPILPVVLSSGVDPNGKNKHRPLGVATGFILSFTFFTLFLSGLVRLTHISPDLLRVISVIVIAGFGLSLLIPKVQAQIEIIFTQLTKFTPTTNSHAGYLGGVLLGLSLGLIWTPCVGPILASVISIAVSGSVTIQTFAITFAYATGTAIPMFIVMHGGRSALNRIPFLAKNPARTQRIFGVLMLITALALLTGLERKFQSYILEKFPQYGAGLTQFENNPTVNDNLDNLDGTASGGVAPISGLQLPKETLAPEIISGGEWFNTAPLTLEQLRGKVVLIDFWTYTCINCQRTFPYLRQWWQRYQDQGLVIIGVHSPEFEFEKNPFNVQSAINEFSIKYPVVQDNEFATWKAYRNRYWPAKYFIDKDGYIRYVHFGEGKYDLSEQVIQDLLKETGATSLPSEVNNPVYDNYAKTPELYLGYNRMNALTSPEGVAPDQPMNFTLPTKIPTNKFALAGAWQVTGEYSQPQQGASLVLNFNAKEVFLVMKPDQATARVKVYVDDKVQFLGDDNQEGVVTITNDRLYKLVNLIDPGQHLLRLEFMDDNAQIFAFTFG